MERERKEMEEAAAELDPDSIHFREADLSESDYAKYGLDGPDRSDAKRNEKKKCTKVAPLVASINEQVSAKQGNSSLTEAEQLAKKKKKKENQQKRKQQQK